MSSRDIRIYGMRQIDDYVPEDRPDQRELLEDIGDEDRTLWQLQHERRKAYEAREARVRATDRRGLPDLSRRVVHLSITPMSGMPRYWATQHTQPCKAIEGGDS